MADGRVSTPTGTRVTVRRHFRTTSQFRSASQSPSRHHRLGDDLLAQLFPNTAVDALRSPTGVLKTCMDQASTSEQAFAMRTAVASKKIYEWLDELSNWSWPAHAGSAGFEAPPAKRRKLAESEASDSDREGQEAGSDLTADTSYLGSLTVADVERYEKRTEKIQQDLDDLDLEEIKNQVLHNHILPLSRPSSPYSEGGRSSASGFMFAKMEDLTAVVTAITVQALPNLSRLTRLLHTWTIRLLVLQKIPSLLTTLAEAEVALRSGWDAVEPADTNSAIADEHGGDTTDKSRVLSRMDFEVMKGVIRLKITKPAHAIDSMLDTLEGASDTLPEEWLDRLEAVERGYLEWETRGERKVLEGEDANPSQPTLVPGTPQPKIRIQGPSPARDLPPLSENSRFASPPIPSEESPAQTNVAGEQDANGVRLPAEQASITILINEPSGEADRVDGKRPTRSVAAASKLTNALSDASRLLPVEQSQENGLEDAGLNPVLGEVDRNVIRNPPRELKKSPVIHRREPQVDEPESSVLEPVDEESEEGEELELPPARLAIRKESRESIASTVIYGPPGGFLDRSDGAPYREDSIDPDLPRLPDPDEPFSSDAISPPSSPPLRYKTTRSTSVTFKDVPEITHLPEPGSSPPRSLRELSEVYDGDTSFEYDSRPDSSGRMSTISSTSDDDHIQQRIGELLQSIPAKIRFSRTPGINLNPPDFQPPSRSKTRPSDTTRRSNSSLSSRAGTPSFSRSGTPSFMLAPAREPRARSRNQGIKVYHLSRSTGEPPIKLFIRCVGERGERVMVRVGGGWADLGEYLREYAVHHSRRSKGEGKVDVKDVPSASPGTVGSSPSSRPASALGSPITPLAVRKTRRTVGEEAAPKFPKTPFATVRRDSDTPSSDASARSRESSRVEWDEEDSSLGLAGPKAKKIDMSEESRLWVESVKEKVRIASGERTVPPEQRLDAKFGEMGKVGGTKRLFRRN
ncbi:hypothetical protein GGS23DRAFT_427576 [Durotheca rogersii]|uniref:uncharacterized protein n=1 Tax=Durotheca rogersii TaxID=419775 RepID=UPI0022210C3E|nr:uncharacterized protein GGS23DRAFT_427576 [Durotheca rogersii]KAI5865457.1 hypothetical protein GGS23DRAFT_427576 [Durotheca rogersii]